MAQPYSLPEPSSFVGNGPDYLSYFHAGQQTVQSVIDAQYQAQQRAALLDQQQKRAALDAQLGPLEVQKAQQQLATEQSLDPIRTKQAQLNLDQGTADYNQYKLEHPEGGFPLLNPSAVVGTSNGIGGNSASPQPSGDGYNLTLKATGYSPTTPDDPAYKMEGGSLDAQGHPIATLDDYRNGKSQFVTGAIDRGSPFFGKTLFSPTLNAPIKLSDTGSAFKGKGNTRIDIARATQAGANSDENNRSIQLSTSLPGQNLPTIAAQSPVAAPAQADLPTDGGSVGPNPLTSPLVPIGTPNAQGQLVASSIAPKMYRYDMGFMDPATNLPTPGTIQQARSLHVPYGQIRLPAPNPAQAKSDLSAINAARRLGAFSDYRLDQNGLLADEDRTQLAADNETAKKVTANDPLYDPDTIDFMAQLRIIVPSDPRGKISGMGPKASAARAQLDAKTAEIGRTTGKTGAEAVLDYAGTTGAKQTIKVQEKQKAAIESFESTAKANAQIALDLLDKGAGGTNGIPVFNRWLQAGRQATGDPEVAAFNTAIGAFKNEYAKIISGSTGSAGASDSSRREAEELINKGGSPEQLRAQIEVAFQEMGNRSKSIDDQIDRLNNSIRDKEKPKGQVAGDATSPAKLKIPEAETLSAARAAIAKGAPREAVIARLKAGGYDTSGF